MKRHLALILSHDELKTILEHRLKHQPGFHSQGLSKRRRRLSKREKGSHNGPSVNLRPHTTH